MGTYRYLSFGHRYLSFGHRYPSFGHEHQSFGDRYLLFGDRYLSFGLRYLSFGLRYLSFGLPAAFQCSYRCPSVLLCRIFKLCGSEDALRLKILHYLRPAGLQPPLAAVSNICFMLQADTH